MLKQLNTYIFVLKVYSERTGELYGMVYNDASRVANHVLVFMVVSVVGNLKFSLGYFGTHTASASMLFALYWEAVFHLEVQCGLKVWIWNDSVDSF